MDRAAFRRHALSLPDAEEVETWGTPTFRVHGKIFAMAGTDLSTASVKTGLDEQAALTSARPDVYSVAPYVGRFGWVAVDVRAADPGELRDLLTEAWRRTAPRRLVAAFDAEAARRDAL
ncbi:hypothetical protein LX15_003784 [Streptoalloteichus tenebrarius]|uniref:MmcQ/YjbR family DNA-binding protein n=1 Tax=Streptoalloteichus tenebrarius (strain ATCC 17920 / DSM 40477 / JCM 4838 / CBS 697.72 / NBRC 16177 / NCIMB 11028 / NRRL B-12390 / A12253. 1 / ISP 5477) TaxID=1933 RepID=A0ABT1HX24_STRSD|nr:MmcQ/YjbR family DNA-binding protein [Streptoalloteichus tenebrarius]MCP2260073.1 hypothetical protein [Streptoalloteichus tenebrarius]BFF00608.1 hypothetical protein GCM10020241_22830 [Streptoalloteichus tenebrarius]